MRELPCGLIVLSDNGHIVEVNATLARWLGREVADFAGAHIDFAFPAGARLFYQTHVFPLLRMSGEVEELYLSLRGKDGSELPALVHGRRDEADGVSVLAVVPMRQRRKYEEEIRKAWHAEERALSKASALAAELEERNGELQGSGSI